MLEVLFCVCLAVPWAAMVYMIAADGISCWKSLGGEEREQSGWTVPLTACPRCGGNTWYDRDRDELRCDTCEWPDPELEQEAENGR